MERPHEYLRRIATSLPQVERPRVTAIADSLEQLGKTHLLGQEQLPSGVLRLLETSGVVLSPGDRLCIAEPWDRPAVKHGQ